jgi:hypothetical protein
MRSPNDYGNSIVFLQTVEGRSAFRELEGWVAEVGRANGFCADGAIADGLQYDERASSF